MLTERDLNYHHLRYFHVVATEGSVLQASRRLSLSPSTVSGQVKTLEEALGQALFQRAGRALVLTPFGEEVLQYTKRIFALGDDLMQVVRQSALRRTLRIGASNVLPKLLLRKMLRPALRPDVRLRVTSGPADTLLGDLAAHRLDVVLTDAPPPTWIAVRVACHPVMSSGISVFGTAKLAAVVGDRLPLGLADVPWLVPPEGTTLRSGLERWWEELELAPDIAAVIDDSALLKALGDDGVGVFAAPESMTDAVLDGYQVQCLGRTDKVRERTFALTLDDQPSDPSVRALCNLAPLEGD